MWKPSQEGWTAGEENVRHDFWEQTIESEDGRHDEDAKGQRVQVEKVDARQIHAEGWHTSCHFVLNVLHNLISSLTSSIDRRRTASWNQLKMSFWGKKKRSKFWTKLKPR